jgi:isopentenyl phosphate kinase
MLAFLKLGGSLITDKTRPYTPRPERLDDLASQIAWALEEQPDLHLVLGHGSGSFGHQAASQFGTRRGVSGPEAWHGFAEVWYQASALNRLVIEALHCAGLPAITISPASTVTARDGRVFIWDLSPLQTTLVHGLLPVIHGDVVFDEARGGTILSTEDLFEHLARELRPNRILLAGLEAGIWEDFPARTKLVPEIMPRDLAHQVPGAAVSLSNSLGEAVGADVTGGMRAKVTQMLALVDEIPGLEVLIFSGVEAGNLKWALLGGNPGTRLHR